MPHLFRRTLPLAALSLFPVIGLAQPSLCTANEVTEWSCAARGKVYSLCASRDLGPDTGSLQYRAGRKSKVEFTYPASPAHPRGHFVLQLAPRGATLSFTNQGHEYVVYEPLAGPTTIDISKDQKPLGAITCASATDTLTLTTTQNRFKALGILQ